MISRAPPSQAHGSSSTQRPCPGVYQECLAKAEDDQEETRVSQKGERETFLDASRSHMHGCVGSDIDVPALRKAGLRFGRIEAIIVFEVNVSQMSFSAPHGVELFKSTTLRRAFACTIPSPSI